MYVVPDEPPQIIHCDETPLGLRVEGRQAAWRDTLSFICLLKSLFLWAGLLSQFFLIFFLLFHCLSSLSVKCLLPIIVFALLLSLLFMDALCTMYASLPLCLYYLVWFWLLKILIIFFFFLCSLMHDLKYFLKVLGCCNIFWYTPLILTICKSL